MELDQSRLEAAERLMDGQDYQAALALYRELAEAGSALAQQCLGTMLLYGQGGDWDVEAGMSWLHRAGEQGMAFAWLNIGTAYAMGTGTLPADLAKAHEYYQRAVEAGCPIVPWLEPLNSEPGDAAAAGPGES